MYNDYIRLTLFKVEYLTALYNLKLLVWGLFMVSIMLGLFGILLLEKDQEE